MIFRWTVLLVSAWLAATISGVAGFGGALLFLPVLTLAVGGESAVPILTVAQLLGNASRAGFGWREIRWRPALLFTAGAVPASLLGSRLFVVLPQAAVVRSIGGFLFLVVAWRHTSFGAKRLHEPLLVPIGAAVGFLSGIAGSAGPLGAAAFLGLQLPAHAYVATEAVSAVAMHLAKSVIYGRYAALDGSKLLAGLALGASMVIGSWTGRKLIGRLSAERFALVAEVALVLSGIAMIVTG